MATTGLAHYRHTSTLTGPSSVDPPNWRWLGVQKHPPLLQGAEEHGFEHFVVGDHEEVGLALGVCKLWQSLGSIVAALRSRLLITASIGLPSAREKMRP